MQYSSRILGYKWITLVLLVCTMAAMFFKLCLIPSMLTKEYTADFRNQKQSGFPYGLSNGSSNLVYNEHESKDKSTSLPETVETTTFNIRHVPSTVKTLDMNGNSSQTFSTVNVINYYDRNSNITNATDLNLKKRLSKTLHDNMTYQTESSMKKTTLKKYMPQDLMTIGPFHFLKNYKNPCWEPVKRQISEPPIRCLPYFYLIGAPKSGTTDLHSRLEQHPDISNLAEKETRWLTRKRFYSIGMRKKQPGLTDYLKFFTDVTREIYMKRDVGGNHRTIFGDCSASTMWDNDYWTLLQEFRNLSEPRYTNADYIYHLNPNTKIIAILRNPVDRLYSDFLYFQHGTAELFHKYVVETIHDTNECLKLNSIRHCLYTPQQIYTFGKVRLRVGVYHAHLKEFLRVFPREQILVFKLEDYSKNPAPYMNKAFKFLEIPELGNGDLQQIANPEKHANKRKEKDKEVGEMLPETRKLLESFYRPHNELLTELLGEQFNFNSDSKS